MSNPKRLVLISFKVLFNDNIIINIYPGSPPALAVFNVSFEVLYTVTYCFSPQGRCKVVRKQDVLDMSKTTKLPSITTVTKTTPRKCQASGFLFSNFRLISYFST